MAPVTNPVPPRPNPSGAAPSAGPGRARSRAARFAEDFRGESGLGSAFAAFLSFRADLLAPDHLDALRAVRESAPPLDAGQRAAALLHAFGSDSAALLEQLDPVPLWSTVSRCAYPAGWNGKRIVVQIAREPLPDSEFAAFERRAVEIAGEAAPRAVSRAVFDQFRQWVRLADDPARERAYLDAAAGFRDTTSARYPAPIPEISKGRVLCWEWTEGPTLASLLEAGNAEASLELAGCVLEQICVLSFLDADLDISQMVLTGGRVVSRRANRLAAIPPPQVRAALRYVSALLSSNSTMAVRTLLKLAWGRVAVEQESAMLAELSALGPELKGVRRFAPTGTMVETNWRALARVSASRPLHVDVMHRNLIQAAYHNSEVSPESDCLIDAQWPVVGRLMRMRAANLLNRETASQWFIGSGLLMFESLRQANRLADEFRDNEVAIGVDQAPRAEEQERHANRSTGVWILIGVFFVMFLISVRWAAVLPPPYSTAGTVFAIAGALGLFWTVSRIS